MASTVLRGALGALLDDDRGAMRLIDETVAAIDDREDAGVLTPLESRLVVATLSSDFPEVVATNQALVASADAAARFVGNAWASFLWVSIDVGAARHQLDAPVAARTEISPGPVADRSDQFLDTMDCLVRIFAGETETALQKVERGLSTWGGPTDSECHAQNVRSGACCHLLLGRPSEGLELAYSQPSLPVAYEGQVADQRASIEVVQAEIRRRGWDADRSHSSM